MKIHTLLQQLFGFTRNEITVILFLSVSFLAGLAIRWQNPPAEESRSSPREFDYALSDSEFVKRSRTLEQLITPPQKSPSKPAPTRNRPATPLAPGSVNINTATKEVLMQLPGIGEQYAERIIIYRDDHGPFSSIDQLDNVKGIGKKTLDRIRAYITVK